LAVLVGIAEVEALLDAMAEALNELGGVDGASWLDVGTGGPLGSWVSATWLWLPPPPDPLVTNRTTTTNIARMPRAAKPHTARLREFSSSSSSGGVASKSLTRRP
jgi:hypothetical protein